MMKAVSILKRKGKAIINTVEIPKRMQHEVLVEVHYAPIHPADLATLTGTYPIKQYPLILGLEASGVIKEADNPEIIGKKVACYSKSGTWCEYITPTLYNILPDYVDLAKASCLTINPLTALVMQKLTHGRSFLVNSANSALNLILLKISQKQNPICIVRNSKAKANLLKIGTQYVIDSSSVGYKDELFTALKLNPCNFAFDFIGGAGAGILLKSIEKDGILYLMGNLGAELIHELDPKEIIFHRKRIQGVHLNDYLADAGKWLKEISACPETFYSNIVEVVEFDQFSNGVLKYAKSMSNGKMVIKVK